MIRGDPGSLLWWPKQYLIVKASHELSEILIVLDRTGSKDTGLFCDSTPTAGSHGRLRRRDSASALGEPDFADVSSILSISKGIFQDKKKKRKNQE